MSDPVLRVRANVWMEPRCFDDLVDCRQLFTGDRHRELVRAYPEAIFRLSRRLPRPAVARYLRASPEVDRFYGVEELEDRVRIVMRDDAFRTQGSLEDLEYELHVEDDAREVDYPLPLEYLHALGTLVPLLLGDRTEAAVRDELRKGLASAALDWATSLLGTLDAEGFLERGPATPNRFLQHTARPRVTFVAHTSLLVQSAQTSVLFDPLFRRSNGFPGDGHDACRLPLGAIALSHAHWDHCDIASLLLFDKRTPLLIPKVVQPTNFNPPMMGALRRLGFTDIQEVEHWKPVWVGDIEIVPVPFHGEQDEPGAVIDHFTYVVRTHGWSVYGGVDSFRDTFGDMQADLERVRRDYRPTVAFLPVSRMVYRYDTGGVNGYCRTMDTTLLGQEFQYTADPNLAVDWVRWLDARYVVPYGTFTFRRAEPAPQAAEFSKAMRKAGLVDRVIALRPLDAIDASDLSEDGAARLRRAFLRRWLEATAGTARMERRLQKTLPYRAIKRLMGRGKSRAQQHH